MFLCAAIIFEAYPACAQAYRLKQVALHDALRVPVRPAVAPNNDAAIGHGVIDYPDRRHYQGALMGRLRHGDGVTTWPDGRRYTGSYVQDRETGHGVMAYANGHVYTGGWLAGGRHGPGHLHLARRQTF